MSAFNDFIAYLSSDEAAVAALDAATGDLEGKAAFDAVAGFANARGFDVTPADAEAFYASLSAGQGELSDDALDSVAGGMSITVMPIDGHIIGGGIPPQFQNPTQQIDDMFKKLFAKW